MSTNYKDCSEKKNESIIDNLLLYFIIPNSADQNNKKRIMTITRATRIKTFKSTLDKFFLFAVAVFLLLYIIPEGIRCFWNYDIRNNIFYEFIKYISEVICIVFSALLGALISNIFTEGIDPLDNWFDEDIIDTFIIKDLEKKLAAYIDENKPSRKIIMPLADTNDDRLITKNACVIKHNSDAEKTWNVVKQFRKNYVKTLSYEDMIKIVDTLKKPRVKEFDKIIGWEEIRSSVKNESETVAKELTKLLEKYNYNGNIEYLTNELQWIEKDGVDNVVVDEIRKKLYYFIDLGYQASYNSNFALIICFTEIQYPADGSRKNYTPYVYINTVIFAEKLENINELKKIIYKTFCDRNEKKYYQDFAKDKFRDPFSGIKDDLEEKASKDAKSILKDYKPFYGIQNFIARKSLGATQNDLDIILNTLYENICKVIDIINGKVTEEPKDEANHQTPANEEPKDKLNHPAIVTEEPKDEAVPPTIVTEVPKDEDITENVPIKPIDKSCSDSVPEDDLDSNIIVGIIQEWLQKHKAEINDVIINKSNIRFTTNKLSKILPKKDEQFTNRRFYEIYVGKTIHCQLCIKLNKTTNPNKATSESRTFCKNYNKIKEICKRQENDKGWLNPYESKMFFVKNDLSKEELKDEVNKNMDICFKGIKEFEKNLEKKLEEKEQ